jgi:signal transduction histidine kinase
MLIASGLLVVMNLAVLGLMFVAIVRQGDAWAASRHSDAVMAAAGRLEKLVTELDADARGFVLNHDQRLMREYAADRAALPARTAELQRLCAGNREEAGRASQIARADDAYVRGYSVPLMKAAQTDDGTARSLLASGQGMQRLASLHDQIAALGTTEHTLAASRTHHFIDTSRTATLTAAASTGAALLLGALFAVHLMTGIIRPVHRASVMAGELAKGDLAVRIPETSPGDIGLLESRFNAMAGSLEASRDELRQFAEEQGALRRVATLVARGVAPSEVFAAVAAEVGRVVKADHTNVVRFEPDDTVTVVGYWNEPGVPKVMPPLGGRWPVEDGTVTSAVLTTQRPARMDDYEHATSAIGTWARRNGIHSVVGCPVKVEDRTWGAMLVHYLVGQPPTGATENRLQEFVELVGTAIANAQVHSDLLASRARVVATADESRRRIQRDLHDGAQQQLVTLALKLRLMEAATAPCQDDLRKQVSGSVDAVSGILDEIQRISNGLAPPILTRTGLRPALRSLARRSPIPMELDVRVIDRLPERVEVAVYYTIAEAVTNVVKHAYASVVEVDLTVDEQTVLLSVRDDGIGGASLGRGSGLVGLKDRIEALGGRIHIVSPTGGGTSLLVDIPTDPD